jgi:type IV pilus assembly protein PilM
MGKRALGIDIGAGSVKIVELEKTSDGIQLLRAKFFDLTQHAEQEKRDALIKTSIEGLLRTEKIRGGKSVVSLSGQSVFIRFLKLPKIQKGKIDKIIKYEAQQQVPFPLEKITWDHQVFGAAGGPEEDVLFVAAKKDIVETTLGYLSNTGLDVELVDISPLALLNAVMFNEPLKRGIIIDIGAKATNLIVVEEKGFWGRSILIAGDEMTHVIASKLSIPFDKAEELKRKEGTVLSADVPAPADMTPAAKEVANILSPVLSDLVASIVQSLEFYRTKQNRDLPFNEVILSGGGSKLKGIENFLAKNLGMQIRRANLVQKIKCPSNLRVDTDFQTRFGSAIGLALRLIQRCPARIDLLPFERKAERDFKKERLYIIASGLLLAVIPLTAALNVSSRAGNFKSELKLINGLLSKYEAVKDDIKSLKTEIKKADAKIKPFRDLTVKRTLLLEVLLEVEELLPLDTWLTAFTDDKGSVILEGKTFSNLSTITEYKKRLESSPLFESVEILYASLPRQSEEDGRQIRDFSIKFKLRGSDVSSERQAVKGK